jgi:hypothetical protein
VEDEAEPLGVEGKAGGGRGSFCWEAAENEFDVSVSGGDGRTDCLARVDLRVGGKRRGRGV